MALNQVKNRWPAIVFAAMGAVVLWANAFPTAAAEPNPEVGKPLWHGFEQRRFLVGGRQGYVVVPDEPAAGRPWVWRTTFPDFHPEVDVALLKRGFFIAYLETSDPLGSPQALAEGEKFYKALTTRHGLAKKVVLEGISRGGLLAYNFALKHPDRVAAIYCDTPVLDFKSWPAGKGTGRGSPGDWALVKQVYGLDEAGALNYAGNPVDRAAALAAAKIPLLHLVSENDVIVPPQENTYLLKERLEKLGGKLEVISVPQGTAESGGHHFTPPDPQRAVDFILANALPVKS